MYCICCKKNNVKPVEISNQSEEDILWKDIQRPDGSSLNINNEMVYDGIIHIIDAGYGSKYDSDKFIIAICDDCIKENLEDSVLLYYGNYMGGYGNLDIDKVEKSKQKYRRKKNLDELT